MSARANCKVLYVEDSTADRFLLRRALSIAAPGAALVEAVDVSSGLDALEQQLGSGQAPSWIFVDLNLPDGSGIDFITEVRARSDHDKVPLVVLSTSSARSDVERAFEAGCNAYVSKPDRQGELQAAIRSLVTLFCEPGHNPYGP